MNHYLALDQASRRIGWAIGNANMLAPLSGVFELPSAGARHGVMLTAARDWLDATVKCYHVTKVGFESPFCGPNPATFALVNKLIGIIELVCHDHNIHCVETMIDNWRNRFIEVCRAPKSIIPPGTSRGKAGTIRRAWLKEQSMIACAHRRWDVKTHDEAEACGILDYLLAIDDEAYRNRTARAPEMALEGAA